MELRTKWNIKFTDSPSLDPKLQWGVELQADSVLVGKNIEISLLFAENEVRRELFKRLQESTMQKIVDANLEITQSFDSPPDVSWSSNNKFSLSVASQEDVESDAKRIDVDGNIDIAFQFTSDQPMDGINAFLVCREDVVNPIIDLIIDNIKKEFLGIPIPGTTAEEPASTFNLGTAVGDSGMMLVEAGKHIQSGYHEKANAIYENLAKRGNPSACYNLALGYYHGLGVEKDLQEVVRLYTIAAEKGHTSAMNNLGIMYKNGVGVDKDEAKWLELLHAAADAGHVNCANILGALYFYGDHVEESNQKAVEYLGVAAKDNHREALNLLGTMYLTKGLDGVQYNEKTGVEYLEKAAKLGCPDSQCKIGSMYVSGQFGVVKNSTIGLAWNRLAAQNGSETAIESEERISAKGGVPAGLELDIQEAIQLFDIQEWDISMHDDHPTAYSPHTNN